MSIINRVENKSLKDLLENEAEAVRVAWFFSLFLIVVSFTALMVECFIVRDVIGLFFGFFLFSAVNVFVLFAMLLRGKLHRLVYEFKEKGFG